MINFAIITVSDSCSVGIKTDDSGKLLSDLILNSNEFSGKVSVYKVIADELSEISDKLKTLCDTPCNRVNVVLTVGGTGFAPRDVTPEATKSVLHKEANGLSLAILQGSLQKTNYAALSRLVCGIRGGTLIVNFPGSKKAVKECWKILEPLIPHAVHLLLENQTPVTVLHKALDQADISPRTRDLGNATVQKHVCSHRESPDVPSRESKYPMVPMNAAFDLIQTNCQPLKNIIELCLDESVGFVLAEDVVALEEQPPFDASIKDGYAVLAADGVGFREILKSIPAAKQTVEKLPLSPGFCYKINTGAPIPAGADAVVQIEDTERICDLVPETEVYIKKAPFVGQDIRPKGSDVTKGELLLRKGGLITSAEIGILASAGHTSKIKVYTKPKVTILSTGDELVPASERNLAYGQIRDSNGPMLKCLLREHGFPAEKVFTTADNEKDLLATLQSAFSISDVVVTSGGVSMGDKDLLKDVLKRDLGFDIHFGRLFMKPGKPTTFASRHFNDSKKWVFALPGNPVSAWVTAQILVIPALRRLASYTQPELTVLRVEMLDSVTNLDPRPEYLRAALVSDKYPPEELDQKLEPKHVSSCTTLKAKVLEQNQSSSRLLSNRGANLLLKLPAKSSTKTRVVRGEVVEALLIGPISS